MGRKPWEDGSTSEAKRQQHIVVRDFPATRTSTVLRLPPSWRWLVTPSRASGSGMTVFVVGWSGAPQPHPYRRPARVQRKPSSLLLRAIETYFSNILLFYWSSFTNIFAGLYVVLRLRNRNPKMRNTIFLLTLFSFNYF